MHRVTHAKRFALINAGTEIQTRIWELADQLASKSGRSRPVGCLQQQQIQQLQQYQPQQVSQLVPEVLSLDTLNGQAPSWELMRCQY